MRNPEGSERLKLAIDQERRRAVFARFLVAIQSGEKLEKARIEENWQPFIEREGRL